LQEGNAGVAIPFSQGAPSNGKQEEAEGLDRQNSEAPHGQRGGTCPPPTEAKTKRLNALDAAAQVLGDVGQAMTCPELVEAMTSKGYWTSPAGKTPAATLYAAIAREIKVKKERARFRKTERGKFALA
jgi:hypothetical protein